MQINGHGDGGDDGNGGGTENPGDQEPVISAEGKIIIGEAEWDVNTHTASVTLNKISEVDENLQVQYQIGGTSEEKWVIGETATGIQHGQTIYARFWNGTKGGAYIEKKIIDGISPGVLVSITGTGTNTITAVVEAGDNQSGLPSSPTYTFSIKEKNDSDSTYRTEQSNSSTTCEFTNLKQNKEYTVKVTVQDKAGNTGEATVYGKTETVVTSEGNITFALNPDSWTNGDVTVTASTTITGYKLQVSTSTAFPTTATQVKSITVSSNQKVYARLIDSTNQANGYVETEVTKIDKTKPVVTVATPTTNSVSITATDEASGIIGYKVTESTTAPTEFTSCTNTKSLSTTVSSLVQNKTYYVWVKDEAGNVSLPKEFKTAQVIASTGNITFEYNPTGWTNGNVTVTGTSQVSGYKVQLSKDGVFPETAIEVRSITVSENQTIYARLVDSTNQSNGQASREVTKIDKDKPIITETIVGTDNIQIKAADGASGIIGYKVTTNNEEPTIFDECLNTKNLDITVSGLNQGTTYYVWVKDEAGNISEASQNTTEKQVEIQDLTLGEYIAYDTGNTEIGNEGIILCRVLYPKSSEYGLQLVTDEGIFDCTLTGKPGLVGSPTVLDNVAKGYFNETYALDTRCIGSSPVNADGKFTQKTEYTKNYTWGLYNGGYSGFDMAASADANYLPEGNGKNCWWMSYHLSYSSTNSCYGSIGVSASLRGSFNAELYSYVKGNRPPEVSTSKTYGVRGCILMKDDIIIDGGNGSKENPFTISRK